jgi:hypothetical protein
MITKEQALFYLNRIRRDIEENSAFDQETAAHKGMSYSERKRATERMEETKPTLNIINILTEVLRDLTEKDWEVYRNKVFQEDAGGVDDARKARLTTKQEPTP